MKVLWSEFSHEIRDMLRGYPATIACVVAATLLGIVVIDEPAGFVQDFILPFLLFLGVGMFFRETIFRGELMWQIGVSFCVAVVSLFFAVVIKNGRELAFDSLISRGMAAYVVVLGLLGLYVCYKRSGCVFPEYGMKVFSNLVKTHVVYVILNMSVLIVTGIITALFAGWYSYMSIISRLMMGVFGFFYVPAWLYSVSSASQDRSQTETFTRVLVKYVLLPIVLVVFVIIYAYILKILIQRDIPSNEIYGILTGLFLAGAPTWTMMENFEKESVWRKISDKLPLFFAPLILLQVYSIGVRIWSYGVTPERYLGVLWIVLEVVYLVLHQGRRKQTGNIILIAAFALAFAFLAPFVNMYQASIMSQGRILAQYRMADELTEKMQRRIYGAYRYLQAASGGKEYVERRYTKEEIAEIEGFSEGSDYYRTQDDMLYMASDTRVSDVDISGYSRMQRVERRYDSSVDPKRIPLGTEDGGEIGTVDIETLLHEYIDHGIDKSMSDNQAYVDISEYVLARHEIEIDAGRKLVVTYVDIDYNRETEKVESLYLSGWLLDKEEE